MECTRNNLSGVGWPELAIDTGVGTALGGILLISRLRPSRREGPGPDVKIVRAGSWKRWSDPAPCLRPASYSVLGNIWL
jgi:hypothetical protein